MEEEKIYSIGDGPYALNEDDSAVDPAAFREALARDPEKLKSIERDEELAKALLGEDTGVMQEALKKVMAMVRGDGETRERRMDGLTRTSARRRDSNARRTITLT